jgi:hypothetical protein
MLQGNPFETERVVADRTLAVRQGVAQSSQSGTTFGRWRYEGQRVKQLAQGQWQVEGRWLPVAMALGMILGVVIG